MPWQGETLKIIKPRIKNRFQDNRGNGEEEFNITFYSYLKRGSDERQYNYPNVNILRITICRDKFNEYDEYHTSNDQYKPEYLKDILESIDFIKKLINLHEQNDKYVKLMRTTIRRRGLYKNISTASSSDLSQDIVDVLNYCDGENDLVDIKNILVYFQ